MKRNKKSVLSVLLTLVLAFSLAVPALAASSITRIRLDRTSASLEVGETLTLEATVYPSNADEDRIFWESSNESVATVSASGRVKGIKAGKTVITVYSEDDTDIYAECSITVTDEDEGDYATDVTITSKDSGSLLVGDRRTLIATVTYKYGDDDERVTWSSSDKSVATVSDGVVKGISSGTATITATAKVDGRESTVSDVYKITVVDDRITVTPSSLSLASGNTATLSYTLKDSSTSKTPYWSSSNSSVAMVNNSGLVTGVSAGTCTITVTVGDMEGSCTVSVTDSGKDEMTLSSQQVTSYGGLYLEKTLTAPNVSIKNGSTDVSANYDIAYTWTDASDKILGSGTTQKVALLTQDTQKYTCLVTAVSKTDTSKQMTKMCTYSISVLPGCEVSGDVTVAGGAVKVLSIKDTQSGLTIGEQLTDGIEGSATTPGIAGLTYVIFDTATQSGTEAGTLNAQSGVSYYLYEGASGSHLSDVTFTPQAAGTYNISFLAYGEASSFFGQLEIRVTGGTATTPVTDPATDDSTVPSTGVLLSRTCDSQGYTFSGSDFFRYNDADPVVSLDFGTPVRGKLVRNFSHGTGTKDAGEKYYTDSAADGQYHISTLTYVPKAGNSGVVSIPTTIRTRSGAEQSGFVQFTIQNKTDSSEFTDVTKDTVGTWAADSVDFAYGTGLMGGMGDKLFGPYENMTRGMLVTVLYRAAGSPNVTTTSSRFRDLDKDAYYYKAVLWASSKSIVNGVETNRFAPDNPVTREQIAVILYRFAEVMGGDTDGDGNLNAFTDRGSVDSYATNAMTWAVSKGIITGTTATTLSPLDYATRAQVTVMLHRYLTL